MSSRAQTRQTMIATAARMFQRDGYHGTSWRSLVAEAGTPWGSIAHHFPGGKEQLGREVIDAGADAVLALIDHCFASTRSPARAIEKIFTTSADLMGGSGFTTACPVASVAMETTHASPALADASRSAFVRWEERIAEHLRAAGVPARRARTVSELGMTLLEGALVRARVHGTPEPLRQAGRHAASLVAV